MASARSIEVKVGILILTAVGLLAAFILVMGGVNFQPTYAIYVDFDNPGGVQAGAPVKIAGVKVGKISEVQFRAGEKNTTQARREPLIRMKVQLEKRYQEGIHADALFFVTTQGVLGEQFLAIDPGSGEKPTLQADSVVRGLDPPRLDMLLAESYELLHSTVSALRSHREEFSDAFDGLRRTLKGTGDFLEKNGARLDRVAENAEQMSLEGRDLMHAARAKYVDNPQIDRILGNVDGLAAAGAENVPALMADARVTLGHAKTLSELFASEPQQTRIKQALSDVLEITDRAKSATKDAQGILEHVKQGKGTVGAVVMDEQLFDDLQELARDLKHNPWKLFWKE